MNTARTRIVETEIGGVWMECRIRAATEADYALADLIEQGCDHAISDGMTRYNLPVNYRNRITDTHTEERIGRPNLKGVAPLDFPINPYACRNLDDEGIA